MSRALAVVLFALVSMHSSLSFAQGRHHHRCHRGVYAGSGVYGGSGAYPGSWNAYPRYHAGRYDRGAVYSGGTVFGFSFGTVPYGYDYAGYPDPYFLYPYSYDPWLRGSFRAPDLLDDPYFYDRVPQYRRTYDRAPLTLQRSYRVPLEQDVLPAESEPLSSRTLPPETFELLNSLQEASETLFLGLGEYTGGEGWVEYLVPNRIVEWAFDGRINELRELSSRYDHVLQSPEFQMVAEIDGFRQTQELLQQYLSQATAL